MAGDLRFSTSVDIGRTNPDKAPWGPRRSKKRFDWKIKEEYGSDKLFALKQLEILEWTSSVDAFRSFQDIGKAVHVIRKR